MGWSFKWHQTSPEEFLAAVFWLPNSTRKSGSTLDHLGQAATTPGEIQFTSHRILPVRVCASSCVASWTSKIRNHQCWGYWFRFNYSAFPYLRSLRISVFDSEWSTESFYGLLHQLPSNLQSLHFEIDSMSLREVGAVVFPPTGAAFPCAGSSRDRLKRNVVRAFRIWRWGSQMWPAIKGANKTQSSMASSKYKSGPPQTNWKWRGETWWNNETCLIPSTLEGFLSSVPAHKPSRRCKKVTRHKVFWQSNDYIIITNQIAIIVIPQDSPCLLQSVAPSPRWGVEFVNTGIWNYVRYVSSPGPISKLILSR